MSKKILFLLSLFVYACIYTSCDDDTILNEKVDSDETELLKVSKEELMTTFSQALSEIVFEEKSVRSLLKNEALLEFDKNKDILWLNVKNKMLGEVTFRDMIINKTSKTFVSQLETQIPLLNILFPDLPNNISAETYNVDDSDLPVAFHNGNQAMMYCNGLCTDTLLSDEIPMYNILVVNENKRVKLADPTRGLSTSYVFVHPAFDNTKKQSTRTAVINNPSAIYNRAKEAYRYFYSSTPGKNSYEYQRDYIYYGVTPNQPKGQFNENARDYITFIEVNPNIFQRISDQTGDATAIEIEQKKCNFSVEQKNNFTKSCWEGNFCFIVYIATSYCAQADAQSVEKQIPITVSPYDLWDIPLDAIKTWRSRKPSIGNHSRYKMTIDVSKLRSKPYFFNTYDCPCIGKWDISKESTVRYLSVYEYDDTEEITSEDTQTFSFLTKASWNVKVQGSYSEDKQYDIKGEGSYSSEEQTNISISQKVTHKLYKNSDSLGKNIEMRYNDPIIEYKDGNYYHVKTYNFDNFKLGITSSY